MLIPGHIPRKEPLIRVGIILPEDAQQQIHIQSNGPVQIFLDKGEGKKIENLDLAVDLFIKKLWCNFGPTILESEILEIELLDPNGFIKVNPVVAGRGFHWKKPIEVKLTNRIELKIRKDHLLLINELPIEKYLASVATSEMSSSCPEEFIIAQCIVARSWMLANIEQKHVHLGFDVCNDDCCQRFQGVNNLNNNSLEIASKSRGKVLTYASSICDARYSKSCGGIMESFENLWEDKKLPYMQNLIDAKSMQMPNLKKEEHMLEWVNEKPKTFCSPHFIPEHNLSEYLGKVDEEAEYFRWKVKVSQEELVENINSKLNHEIKAVNALKVLKRGGSGRMLELRIDYLDKNDKQDSIIVYKDYDARDLLHPSFLYSSACIISPIHSDNSSYPDFEYQGAGWGHGAGMCQIGALGMALAGYKANEILEHYYPGSKMDVIYP